MASKLEVILNEEEFRLYEKFLGKKLATYGALGLGLLGSEAGIYKYLDSQGEFDDKKPTEIVQDTKEEPKTIKHDIHSKDTVKSEYKLNQDSILINFIKSDAKKYGTKLEPNEAEKIYFLAKKYCQKFKVDLVKYLSLVARESHFDKNAKSLAKAKGLGQLMPGGGEAQAVQDLKLTHYNIFDIEDNIKMSTYYLSWCMKAEKGDFERALARYNGGWKQSALYNKIRNGELDKSKMARESYEYIGYILNYQKIIRGMLSKLDNISNDKSA